MTVKINIRQQGAALFISLMFLIVLTLIGLSVANVGVLQERMSSNVRQSNVAFQRAEAGIRSIEKRVKQIAQGGSGGLGQIPIWSTTLESLGITQRGDCTLSGADTESWPWLNLPEAEVPETEYTIVELSGATADGNVFGSACRPMQSEDAGNPGQSAVYYLIAARAVGEDNVTEAVVQSIYFYP
ncbi:MAG: PilX N-terminal domain-containing pilus assembly protein [Wenzhouxiangellaceae bacterium]|nr:PilX N-terminal domain-containing pilus assembly protein [Wenzhouxiangellaceae bacterium]